MADPGHLRIAHSAARERYEAILTTDSDGDEITVGYVDYVSEPYQVVLTHTVIPDAYSGRGYAGQLVQAVLDDIRKAGKQVVPVCSYVRRFIDRHPEYADMAVPVPQ
ncbi:GNAT family N-acetyltransferase [Gordonia sp. L191]|uniref:GNAT family N-acetyltransferase n=1 Tax=Gordonia TaxID=2053 RepID=UPI001AD625AE|nr:MULTISPECIES: GNAT family N-acetyltransferase [Gordonia]QTI70417.1 N-acetyltransferase [Gordonia polyisoprenivorans]WHU46019.1 GNAT family N-acetyltransferase [Gordonia sp. L191]